MPNARQNFANVAKDQFSEIKEFAANYSKRERKSLPWGGDKRDRSATSDVPVSSPK